MGWVQEPYHPDPSSVCQIGYWLIALYGTNSTRVPHS